MYAYGVCYLMEMLRNAAEIARRFLCLIEWFWLRFFCKHLYKHSLPW